MGAQIDPSTRTRLSDEEARYISERAELYFEEHLHSERVTLEKFQDVAVELAKSRSSRLLPIALEFSVAKEAVSHAVDVVWDAREFHDRYAQRGRISGALTRSKEAAAAALLDQSEASLDRARAELERQSKNYNEVLQSLVFGPTASEVRPAKWGLPDEEEIIFLDGEALTSKSLPEHLIETSSRAQIALSLARSGGASIGVAGPRGAGKSELVNFFAQTSETRIAVKLWAPVSFDSKSFFLWMLRAICGEILDEDYGDRSPITTFSGFQASRRRLRRSNLIRRVLLLIGILSLVLGLSLVIGDFTGYDIRGDRTVWGVVLTAAGLVVLVARRLTRNRRFLFGKWIRRREVREHTLRSFAQSMLNHARFTESLEASGEGALKGGLFEAKYGEKHSFAARQMSELDVIEAISEIVDRVSAEGMELVVSIDELDKMPSDEMALEFVNRLKVLFNLRGASFLVSVSDRAWIRFTQRGMPFRDAFDSSFDEVVRVGYLSLAETRELLEVRAPFMSDLQIGLVHSLAGALPRDILRFARQLARAADSVGEAKRNVREAFSAVATDEFLDKVHALELRLADGSRSSAEFHSATSVTRMLKAAWPSVEPVEQVLFAYLKHRSAWVQSPSKPPLAETAIELSEETWRSIDELVSYVAILATLLRILEPDEVADKLSRGEVDESVVESAFADLAIARNRIPVDPWLALDFLEDTRLSVGASPLGTKLAAGA